MGQLKRSLLICVLAAAAVGVPRAAVVSIRGTVVDVSGGVVPGVAVELTRGIAHVAKVFTDADGAFAFADVPDGDYVVTAALEGFLNVSAKVRLADGSPREPLKLVMHISGVAETVTVTASTPLITTQSSQTSGRRSPEFLSVVPLRPNAPFSTAVYDPIKENGFKRVADAPLSTFSIDVDTASYANVRRFLSAGSLPPADAVRVEELINYFHFDYPAPGDGKPFSVTTELGACPWNEAHQLALVGLHSAPIASENTPPRNLVFLLDVSGSMESSERLPLVQSAMLMLTSTLRDQDRVAIVVYAGSSGVALPSTAGSQKSVIEAAIQQLRAGGSTNGAEGIALAYNIAAAHFIKGGINRVLLATDGDFNVGVTSPGDLVALIQRQRERGVFLSVLGVGDDNLKDGTMEKLADAGNGNYSYLDSLPEAQRVLVAEAGATLATVAKDVKIQIEFNPTAVQAYRLIGYEDRLLANEDFKDDRKDAGDMGAGHNVTALYEIVRAGQSDAALPSLDPLKYQAPGAVRGGHGDELMTIKLRYKAPEENESKAIEVAVAATPGSTANLGFAGAVAEFGMLLRDSPFKAKASWRQAADLAKRHRGDDPDGYRAEFIRLVSVAASLKRHERTGTR